jgi:ComF family protein
MTHFDDKQASDLPRAVGRRVRTLMHTVLDLLLPPLCLACQDFVRAPHGLCGACWSGLDFVAAPFCQCCGRPFEFETPEVSVCGDCLVDPPDFEHARAALLYGETSRSMILRFKHGDALHLAPLLAGWLGQAGDELLQQADLLVPVPLHRSRLLARRYNQAAELARALGRAHGINVAPDLLIRHRRTQSQGGFGRTGRDRNVRGAFRIKPASKPLLRDRRVLLVDDVMTSGATVNACARALKANGAAAVDVLVVARVE